MRLQHGPATGMQGAPLSASHIKLYNSQSKARYRKCLVLPEGGKLEDPEINPHGIGHVGENQHTTPLAYGLSRESNQGHALCSSHPCHHVLGEVHRKMMVYDCLFSLKFVLYDREFNKQERPLFVLDQNEIYRVVKDCCHIRKYASSLEWLYDSVTSSCLC